MAKRKTLTAYVLPVIAGAASLSSSLATDASGQPVQRFRKDIISVGEWVHPNTGEKISVTRERLARFAATFAAMKAAGVRVPVPSDHTESAEKNRGWVEDMWVEGDRLYAELSLIGDDAIREASRNHVSIFLMGKLTDGKGNEYDDAIAHVALTPTPVISGQDGFIALSAGRVPVLSLAGANDMDYLKKVALALGITIGDGAKEDEVEKMVMDAIAKLKDGGAAAATAAKEATEAKAALSTARTTIAELEAKLKPREIDPTVLKLSRKNRELELSRRVESGKLSQAAADKIKAAWIGDDKALALSMSPAMDAAWEQTLEAIDVNEPKPKGEVTRGQALARQTPGEKGDDAGDWGAAAAKAHNEKHAKK